MLSLLCRVFRIIYLKQTMCSRKGQSFVYKYQWSFLIATQHTMCNSPHLRHHASCDVTTSLQKFLPLGDAKKRVFLCSVVLQKPWTPLVWLHTVNAKRAFQHSVFSAKRHRGVYNNSTRETIVLIRTIYSRTCVKVQLTLLCSLQIPIGNE